MLAQGLVPGVTFLSDKMPSDTRVWLASPGVGPPAQELYLLQECSNDLQQPYIQDPGREHRESLLLLYLFSHLTSLAQLPALSRSMSGTRKYHRYTR